LVGVILAATVEAGGVGLTTVKHIVKQDISNWNKYSVLKMASVITMFVDN
jgi:hypothetical protein